MHEINRLQGSSPIAKTQLLPQGRRVQTRGGKVQKRRKEAEIGEVEPSKGAIVLKYHHHIHRMHLDHINI